MFWICFSCVLLTILLPIIFIICNKKKIGKINCVCNYVFMWHQIRYRNYIHMYIHIIYNCYNYKSKVHTKLRITSWSCIQYFIVDECATKEKDWEKSKQSARVILMYLFVLPLYVPIYIYDVHTYTNPNNFISNLNVT